MLLPTFASLFVSSWYWVTLLPVIEISDTSFFYFLLGIGPRYSDWDIIELLLSSRDVLGIFILMSFGSCSANLLSFELDNCTDIFYYLLSQSAMFQFAKQTLIYPMKVQTFFYFLVSLFFLLQLKHTTIYPLEVLYYWLFFANWLLYSVESMKGLLEVTILSFELFCLF